MIMIDLGQGVKVNAENRCYFKVDCRGKMLTVRTDGGKVPHYEEMTEMQRQVIKANLVQPKTLLTMEERALEEAKTGNVAPIYRDMVDKDIVTFFDNSHDSEEVIQVTASQLAELVASKQGINDDDTGEIASLQEENEELKEMLYKAEEKLSALENERKVKDEQVTITSDVGGDASGRTGKADTKGSDGATEKRTSGTRGRPRAKTVS